MPLAGHPMVGEFMPLVTLLLAVSVSLVEEAMVMIVEEEAD